MALVPAKPTSAGRRFVIRVKDDIHKGSGYKPLIDSKNRKGGRNNTGRIMVRHQGGGHKQRYRMIDFKRDKVDIEGKVERLEHDPNRSARIALILYADGERRYIIAPKGLKSGDCVLSSKKESIPIRTGYSMPLCAMPVGTVVHAIEMKPGRGAQLARSAGTSAQLVAKDDHYAVIRLSSGEVRKILVSCQATVGSVGFSEHNLRSLGKAGASRWRGIRPTVRGVAMNPVDHPHGGGEGKTSGGRHPVSYSGVPTKGYKTRQKKKASSRLILKTRKGLVRKKD